jgi:hypothetical protein
MKGIIKINYLLYLISKTKIKNIIDIITRVNLTLTMSVGKNKRQIAKFKGRFNVLEERS